MFGDVYEHSNCHVMTLCCYQRRNLQSLSLENVFHQITCCLGVRTDLWFLCTPFTKNWRFVLEHICVKVKRMKFSHTCYQALGPELIPVYKSSARRWLVKSSPAVGCHYFPPGLWSPSQPKNVTVLRLVPSYIAWWQRHIGGNNWSKVVTQLCTSENRTHDLLIASPVPYCYATMPPRVCTCVCNDSLYLQSVDLYGTRKINLTQARPTNRSQVLGDVNHSGCCLNFTF